MSAVMNIAAGTDGAVRGRPRRNSCANSSASASVCTSPVRTAARSAGRRRSTGRRRSVTHSSLTLPRGGAVASSIVDVVTVTGDQSAAPVGRFLAAVGADRLTRQRPPEMVNGSCPAWHTASHRTATARSMKPHSARQAPLGWSAISPIALKTRAKQAATPFYRGRSGHGPRCCSWVVREMGHVRCLMWRWDPAGPPGVVGGAAQPAARPGIWKGRARGGACSFLRGARRWSPGPLRAVAGRPGGRRRRTGACVRSSTYSDDATAEHLQTPGVC